MDYTTINPANGAVIATHACWDEGPLAQQLERSAAASLAWGQSAWVDRVKVMQQFAAALTEAKVPMAEQIVLEMGKPMTEALAEVDKCIACCQALPDLLADWLQPQPGQTASGLKFEIQFAPIGLIFAIMPWNFPLWQIMRCWVPGVLMGNGLVLSPAPCTLGVALLMERLIEQTDLPADVFRCLVISEKMAEQVIAHRGVQGVTLTGSQRAGRAVAALAGQHLKKTVLELGGSDPYLVLDDADVSHAAAVCVKARLANAGQVCIAAKRLLVTAGVYDAFVSQVLALATAVSTGDPQHADTQMGPMARVDLRDQLHGQVQDLIAAGARCVLGGTLPEGSGSYYPPTVLLIEQPDQIDFSEELFGPVIVIIKAADTASAIAMANDTEFGLTAAVFSQDIQAAQRVAQALQVGCCAINAQVRSYFEVPFGGTKRSGYGRELGQLGCYEFMNIKTVLAD